MKFPKSNPVACIPIWLKEMLPKNKRSLYILLMVIGILTKRRLSEMNRKEFQEWLNQFPEDTIIEVGNQEKPSDYAPFGEVYFDEFKGIHWMDYEYLNIYGVLKLGSKY